VIVHARIAEESETRTFTADDDDEGG
jgi:hypothetical protein